MTDKQITIVKKECINEPYCTIADILKQRDQLKAELELYKKSKQASYEEMQRRWIEVEQQSRKYKKESEKHLDDYFKISQKYSRLKRTLAEIKEILLFNEKELEECLHNDIDGQILQKISEVE